MGRPTWIPNHPKGLPTVVATIRLWIVQYDRRGYANENVRRIGYSRLMGRSVEG